MKLNNKLIICYFMNSFFIGGGGGKTQRSIICFDNKNCSLCVDSKQIFIKLQEFQKSQFGGADSKKICIIETAMPLLGVT